MQSYKYPDLKALLLQDATEENKKILELVFKSNWWDEIGSNYTLTILAHLTPGQQNMILKACAEEILMFYKIFEDIRDNKIQFQNKDEFAINYPLHNFLLGRLPHYKYFCTEPLAEQCKKLTENITKDNPAYIVTEFFFATTLGITISIYSYLYDPIPFQLNEISLMLLEDYIHGISRQVDKFNVPQFNIPENLDQINEMRFGKRESGIDNSEKVWRLLKEIPNVISPLTYHAIQNDQLFTESPVKKNIALFDLTFTIANIAAQKIHDPNKTESPTQLSLARDIHLSIHNAFKNNKANSCKNIETLLKHTEKKAVDAILKECGEEIASIMATEKDIEYSAAFTKTKFYKAVLLFSHASQCKIAEKPLDLVFNDKGDRKLEELFPANLLGKCQTYMFAFYGYYQEDTLKNGEDSNRINVLLEYTPDSFKGAMEDFLNHNATGFSKLRILNRTSFLNQFTTDLATISSDSKPYFVKKCIDESAEKENLLLINRELIGLTHFGILVRAQEIANGAEVTPTDRKVFKNVKMNLHHKFPFKTEIDSIPNLNLGSLHYVPDFDKSAFPILIKPKVSKLCTHDGLFEHYFYCALEFIAATALAFAVNYITGGAIITNLKNFCDKAISVCRESQSHVKT